MTRLGVAGLGWLGESLIKDAAHMSEFEVVAVQDVAAGRAQAIAAEYGARWSGEDYASLLAQPGVEAVLICTPNHLHASQAQAALLAGKEVLVQKPLALSAADAQRTVDVSRSTDRLLFVDYTYRFLETMTALREALHEPVRAVRAVFHNIYGPGAEKRWFWDPATSGGGALMDLGVHLVDLGLWLVQPRSTAVAIVRLSDEQPVEHAAELRIQLDDVPFDLAVSWNAALPETQISFEVETISGEVVRWENVDGSFFHFRTRRGADVLLDRETTLREDTLRAFAAALADPRSVPTIDTRVYEILDAAYGRLTPAPPSLPGPPRAVPNPRCDKTPPESRCPSTG